jgi:3-deoxy-7-phosphoheptulonate synthase
MEASGLPCRLMVDASHGNSRKKPENQADVVREVAEQIGAGERRLFGMMIESHLVAGRQDLVSGQQLTYGQSITDGCAGWEVTVRMLDMLAEAVSRRRATSANRAA